MAQAERLLVQGSERGAGASLQANVIGAAREADPRYPNTMTYAQARTRALQTYAQGPMTAHVEAAREALGAKYALRANEYSSQAQYPRQAKANASYHGGMQRLQRVKVRWGGGREGGLCCLWCSLRFRQLDCGR